MGYFYDGSTTLYWYDDNDGTGHVVGAPHSLAEGLTSPAWSPFMTNPGVGIYQVTKAMRAGDNVAGHVNPTTLQESSANTIVFTPAGAFTTGVPNAAGIIWRLGQKIDAGDSMMGARGLSVINGGACTLRGDIQAFGCFVRAQSWNMLPFDGISVVNEAAGNVFFCNGLSSAGTSSGTAFRNFFNNTYVGIGGTNPMTNLFAVNQNGNRLVAVGSGYVCLFLAGGATGQRLKRIVLSGLPSTGAQIASNTAPQNWFVIEPKWTDQEWRKYRFLCDLLQLVNGYQHQECWGFHTEVVDAYGGALPGIPVKLTDMVTGQVQVNTVTDQSGDVAFGYDYQAGQPVVGNFAIVEDFGNWEYPASNEYSRRYRGPFLLEVNSGAGAVAPYPSRRLLFDWPFVGTSRKTGQYVPIFMPVNLGSPPGPGWVECTTQ